MCPAFLRASGGTSPRSLGRARRGMVAVRVPPEHLPARSVLLDALDALAPHLDALVLVGAQAVYLHIGNAELIVAPTLTDADLAIFPARLLDAPCSRTPCVRRASGWPPTRAPGEVASG